MASTVVWTTRSSPTGVGARVVPRLRKCDYCGMLCNEWPGARYCDETCHRANRPQDFNDDDDGG